VGEIGLHTIGDLADHHVIYAHCRPCQRSVQLDSRRLVAVYGAGLTIPELRKRLTCAQCRERRREIRIVFSLRAR
jgi:hypothetical protein